MGVRSQVKGIGTEWGGLPGKKWKAQKVSKLDLNPAMEAR